MNKLYSEIVADCTKTHNVQSQVALSFSRFAATEILVYNANRWEASKY